MSNAQTFVDACLTGDALLDDIDDWVDRWHDAGGAPSGYPQELDEYLGLSDIEYSLWVERPSALRIVIASRHRGVQLDQMKMIAESAMAAARSSDDDEARSLLQWLQQTGRLPIDDDARKGC